MKKTRIRELYEHYIDVMAEWKVRLAIARMRQFGLPQDAWDDVMQELALLVSEFRFDPAKAGTASEETILCRAMDNRIRELARANARYQACQDRLCEMAHPTSETYLPEDAAADKELHEIIRQLTPLQQKICQGLMEGRTVRQIAKQTGWAWTTIERQIEHIRGMFLERGYSPWQM